MHTLEIFIYGFVGGISPEILRILRIIKENEFKKLENPVLYLCFSVVLAILAGFFALALKPGLEITAIWIGISTPLIINTLIKNAYPFSEKIGAK